MGAAYRDGMGGRATPFGARVRSLRQAMGLSQAELAEASGISERTVSDLERGLRSRVHPATARRLAAALKVPEWELAGFLLAAHGTLDSAVPAAQGVAAPAGVEAERFRWSGWPAQPAQPARRAGLARPTRLIGREALLASVVARVRDPEVRLVTLVGVGGVGKTRLAAEVAAVIGDAGAHCGWFLDLAALDDPRLVLARVAAGVGLRPDADGLGALLAARLGSDGSLLVLDTFEHLLPAAADIAGLIEDCPALTVVVTSRSALNVRGEHEVPVPPLPLIARPGDSGTSPAAELFLERTRAVAPDLPDAALPPDLVAQICTRLDGLPLAIELAAARIRFLSPVDLLADLDHRLDLLVGGPRDLPDRQRTLRATLDWSYALLGDVERKVLPGLSVFRGTFDRRAAGSVLGAATDDASLAAGLSGLVDASLVVSPNAADAHGRYRLLDLVREFAAERAAESGDIEVLRRRHAEHYLALAEQAEPELRGGAQRQWYERLLADEGNFRAAIGWALESGRDETALRLAAALWMFWRRAGLLTEGRSWLDAALLAGADCPVALRARGLWGAGWLAYHHGDFAQTEALGRQLLDLLADEDFPVQRRNALTLIGNAALAQGRSADALRVLREALAACEGENSGWHVATSHLNVGMALLRSGRAPDAAAQFQQALTAYEDLADRYFTAVALIQLGYAALADGYQDRASGYIRRALHVAVDSDDAWTIAEALQAVANLCEAHDPETSATLAATADRQREQISMRSHPADEIINREHLERARVRLGNAAFDAAWGRGRQASRGSAVATAQDVLG